MKFKIEKYDTEIDVNFIRGLAIGFYEDPLHIKKDDSDELEWSSITYRLMIVFFVITWSRIYLNTSVK